MAREVYRQFRRSKGFSDFEDAGTNHPDADASCWWCWKPVLSELHDFHTCHEEMFYTVTHYKRESNDSMNSASSQLALDLPGGRP